MFLDSNIFIHLYRNPGKEGNECKRLYARLVRGEQNACTSPLVLDEVIYFFMERESLDLTLSLWNQMRRIPNLKMLAVDENALGYVEQYIRQGLAPRDAFHAAVMRANRLSTICSYDSDFDKIKGIKRQVPK